MNENTRQTEARMEIDSSKGKANSSVCNCAAQSKQHPATGARYVSVGLLQLLQPTASRKTGC